MLIISENIKLKEIVSQIIEKQSINIVNVEDGIEALYLLKKEHDFDVLIIDNDMVEMSGIELIKKIRNHSIHELALLPIILLFNSDEDGSLNRICIENGVRQLILKPVNSPLLMSALSQIKDLTNDDIFISNFDQVSTTSNTKTVLIVDDNKVNVLLAKAILKKLLPEANIVEANDGNEAVEVYKSTNPDIVFMDVQMPLMNGYEAATAIRLLETADKRTPIIALTAGTVLGEKARCVDAGMDDYVSKPFVKEAIIKVLSDWLK